MKLSQQLKEMLKANWDRAETLSCFAEVRLYDPLSKWQCYLLAMDPQDENEVFCILHTGRRTPPEVTEWTMHEIGLVFNEHGEGVEIDTEFRRREAVEVFKRLKGAR